MYWIYLSPHLDDAVFSCGGLIWQQATAGERVEVWTICAGDPPEGELSPLAKALHARWQIGLNPAAARRTEDAAACRRLGAFYHHFSLPDCIYRRSARTNEPVVALDEDLFAPLHPDEAGLPALLAEQLTLALPAGSQVACPLTLGGHMDHRLVRSAAEQLNRPLWYYADYPYAAQPGAAAQGFPSDGLQERCFGLETPALAAWQAAAGEYGSQISTFWAGRGAMIGALEAFYRKGGGSCLWKMKTT